MSEEDIKILEEKMKKFNKSKSNILDLDENVLLRRLILDAPEVQLVENLIKKYRELEEREIWSIATIEGLKKEFIPKSKIKEEILIPMKEEHDKAIKECLNTDILERAKAGAVAQELSYFIGKIEELLEGK